jgi:hypothetical protein
MDTVFGEEADYAMLQKLYGADPIAEKRYSPAKCIGAVRKAISGDPDPAHISTSYAERQNLTMRMQMRRFYAVHQRVLEEIREPHAHGCALHRLVQRWRRVLARRFGSLPALPR